MTAGPEVVQREVGRTSGPLAACVVGGVLAVAAIGWAVAAGPGVVAWLVGALGVAVLLAGLVPWLAWHGLELRVDDEGVRFGSDRVPARPPLPVAMARQAYRVPWSALADAQLVEGAGAVPEMRRFTGNGNPTTVNGFFVRPGAPAHLSVFVDPARTALPLVRERVGTNAATPSRYHPSRRWLFPVRDAEAVVAAFQARGIPLERTSLAATPVPCPDWAAAETGR